MELRALAPAAKDELVVKGNDVSKLTKKEICALLLSYFVVKEDINKKRKGDIILQLEKEVESNPNRLL
jgi:hypothetical protein